MKKQIKKILRMAKSKEMVPVIQSVPDSDLLKDKVAFIVGGSGGIGMAIGEKLLDAGAKVILGGTNEEKLRRCCLKITARRKDNERIKSITVNLKDISSFGKTIQEASRLFDNHPIDILINAAGVINQNTFWETTEEEYDRIMSVNIKGVYFMCREMGKHMIENHVKGHILNVSSSSAIRPAWTPYQISKWAVRGFTLGLADTLLPHGIVVNAIGPGPTATEMLGKDTGDSIYNANNPSGRFATPEEIATLSLYMVSGMGDLVVGETYYITGGGGTISYHR